MQDNNDSHSFVRITNREIYDAIVNLREKVAGIDRRVDAVLTDNQDLRAENKHFEKRLRSLELKTYAALSGLITTVPILARIGGII